MNACRIESKASFTLTDSNGTKYEAVLAEDAEHRAKTLFWLGCGVGCAFAFAVMTFWQLVA